jgi:hypothetical protein
LEGRENVVVIESEDMVGKLKEAEERGRKLMEYEKNKEISELEAVRRAKEAKEKQLADRISKLVVMFKGHIQKLILPGLFFRGIASENDEKRSNKLKEYEDTFPPIQDAIITNIKSVMVRAARSLWDEEESLHVILSNKYTMYGE